LEMVLDEGGWVEMVWRYGRWTQDRQAQRRDRTRPGTAAEVKITTHFGHTSRTSERDALKVCQSRYERISLLYDPQEQGEDARVGGKRPGSAGGSVDEMHWS
jgi:hypothetical protein